MFRSLKDRTQLAASITEVASAKNLANEQLIDWGRTVTRPRNMGWLPALSLTGACGLLLIAVADAMSRSGIPGAEPLFWAGLLVLVMPVAARLATSQAGRNERISLVVAVALEMYLVKVMHSSFAFTFNDELLHFNNALRILQDGALFPDNPILPVSTLYPGLETVTAALASVSGLSAFSAGLLVVGAARLVSTLALFLFYEKVSDSTKAAGLAALIYTAAPNYVYFSAQYSYESLALPLTLLVLYAATHREKAVASSHTGFTMIALLGIVGVVVTHHLSSYFLVAFLILWTLLHSRVHLLAIDVAKVLVRRQPDVSFGKKRWRVLVSKVAGWWRSLSNMNPLKSSSPAGLALFAAVVCLAWLVCVASLTTKYLSPILGPAVNSIFHMIKGEEQARQLFHSSSGYVAPVLERAIGIGAVLICLAGLPFGLRTVWQRYRDRVLVLVLTGAALAYFGMLGLRFTPAAWETGNRASEFLFLGLAFVLAFTGLDLWQPRGARWLGSALFAVCVVVAVTGGVIASWQPRLRLAQPYRIAGGVAIEPQGLNAARWALTVLGPNNRLAADTSNELLMMAYGRQNVFGDKYNTEVLLLEPEWGNWQRNILRDAQIRYLVVDRRQVSWDNMVGLYFDQVGRNLIPVTGLIESEESEKFDMQEDISRLFDSGNIRIYDVGAVIHVSSQK